MSMLKMEALCGIEPYPTKIVGSSSSKRGVIMLFGCSLLDQP